MDPKDDPEVRIRELERSLSDAAGTSELTASPTTRSTTRLGGSRAVVLVVAVGLLALAAGITFLVARLSGSTSSTGLPSSRPSMSNTTTSPANQSTQRLYQLLPRGYSSKDCSPISSPNRQALATVECDKTSDPRSPAYAAFSVYPNATALDKAFQDGISEDTVTPCPHGGDSPGIWNTDGASNGPAGSVLCGSYKNGPDLLWTQNKDLLIGDIQGSDLNALYEFWQSL